VRQQLPGSASFDLEGTVPVPQYTDKSNVSQLKFLSFLRISFLSPSQMSQDSNHNITKQIGDYYFFLNEELGKGTFATVSVSYFDLGRVLIKFVLGML